MRAIGTVLSGVAFLFLASGAGATSVKYSHGPAELPPAGFKGKQFVDSKGCAFIKAGYSGSISWVPRAHRNRQVMCGMTPTFARSTSRVAVKTKTTNPATGPVAVLRPATITNAPRTVVQVAAPRTVVKRPQVTVSGAPAPTVFTSYRKTAPAPVASEAPVVTVLQGPTVGGSQISPSPAPTVFVAAKPKPVAKPLRVARHGGYAIRRGPQKVHPADAVKRYRREHGIQVASAPYAVPAGYVSLLNETSALGKSGVGTPEGQAAMDLLWTQTMPRKLIDVTTGKDMTASLSQIKYPYTSVTAQRVVASRSVRTAVTRPGVKRIKKPVSDEASPLNMSSLERITSIQDVSALTTRQPVQPIVRPVASHRFVQVATFGVPNNARRTKTRFSDKGLPVDTRPTRYKGKKMDIVLLGPFRDQRMLDEALTQARAAGFKDAFLVN